MEGTKKEEEKEKEEVVVPMKPIYPNIESTREGNTLRLSTFLRKKFRKKWYLWHFERRAYVPEGENDWSAAFSSFNRDIYMCQLFGKVDPDAEYRDGTKVYELDLNQDQTERERLDPNRFFKKIEDEEVNK